MSEPSIRIAWKLRNRIVGKALLVVVLSVLAGLGFAATFADDYAKGQALTLEAYTADFDAYRAGLLDTTIWPAWGWMMMSVLMLGGAVVIYELAGWLFGWLVGKAWPDEEQGVAPPPLGQ